MFLTVEFQDTNALFYFNIEVLSKLIRPEILPRLLASESKHFSCNVEK